MINGMAAMSEPVSERAEDPTARIAPFLHGQGTSVVFDVHGNPRVVAEAIADATAEEPLRVGAARSTGVGARFVLEAIAAADHLHIDRTVNALGECESRGRRKVVG